METAVMNDIRRLPKSGESILVYQHWCKEFHPEQVVGYAISGSKLVSRKGKYVLDPSKALNEPPKEGMFLIYTKNQDGNDHGFTLEEQNWRPLGGQLTLL